MKITHISSVHPRYDIRIFHKMASSISQSGNDCSLVVFDGLGNELLNGVRIIDLGKVSKFRFLSIISITLKLYFLLVNKKTDIFHLHDPELFFIGLLLRFKNRLVVFDLHEDIFTQIVKKKYLKYYTNYLCSICIKLLFFLFLRYFNYIVCATNYISNKYRFYNEHIDSVQNYPKVDLTVKYCKYGFRTISDQSFLTHCGNIITLSNKFIITYVGDISFDRGLVEMVQLSKMLPSNVIVVLAGQYTCIDSKELLIKSHEQGLICYLGLIDRNRVSNLLDISNVGLCLLKPVENYYNSKPTKIYEYMLHRVPFLASNFPEITKIVKNYKCGVIVDPKNPQAVSSAALNLISDEKECKKFGQNGRHAILKKYNWSSEFLKLQKIYKQLIQIN